MAVQAELLWEKRLEAFGESPYQEYRIPGVAVTEQGTLLCCYEGRMSAHDDWAKIDTVVCRSADDGETWRKTPITIPETLGGQLDDAVNNPTLIPDGERTHLIFHQNYARAFHLMSVDDGFSWSFPTEITGAFRAFPLPWNVCATGPGHGLRMRGGRLVAPVWLADGERIDDRRIAHSPSRAGAIYSDDHGRTWHTGALTEGICNANETCVAELANGSLLFNFRNGESDYLRRLALSVDGGQSLGRPWACQSLPDPMCFGGMTALRDGTLLFVNCDSGAANPGQPRARIHTTVKVSQDDGKTWRVLARVSERGGYADLAVWGNALYVFYEVTDSGGRIAALKLKKYRLTFDA